MDIEKIRELRLAHPFRPFNLRTKDGRRLPVDEAYYLGIAPSKRFIMHSSVGGGFERLRPEDIEDVDYDDPASLRHAVPPKRSQA